MRFFSVWCLLILFALVFQNAQAEDSKELSNTKVYTVAPGDVLEITVWKEEGLQKEVLVRPDGGLSFPLVGDFKAQGLSLQQIQKHLVERLVKYIPDPVVTVAALKLLGNKIYVVGKVIKPGEYVTNSYVDIVQALAMAGGMTPFAATNDIKVLRRDASGSQMVLPFKYTDIEDGKQLKQNVILQSGDVIVVP